MTLASRATRRTAINSGQYLRDNIPVKPFQFDMELEESTPMREGYYAAELNPGKFLLKSLIIDKTITRDQYFRNLPVYIAAASDAVMSYLLGSTPHQHERNILVPEDKQEEVTRRFELAENNLRPRRIIDFVGVTPQQQNDALFKRFNFDFQKTAADVIHLHSTFLATVRVAGKPLIITPTQFDTICRGPETLRNAGNLHRVFQQFYFTFLSDAAHHYLDFETKITECTDTVINDLQIRVENANLQTGRRRR